LFEHGTQFSVTGKPSVPKEDRHKKAQGGLVFWGKICRGSKPAETGEGPVGTYDTAQSRFGELPGCGPGRWPQAPRSLALISRINTSLPAAVAAFCLLDVNSHHQRQ